MIDMTWKGRDDKTQRRTKAKGNTTQRWLLEGVKRGQALVLGHGPLLSLETSEKKRSR